MDNSKSHGAIVKLGDCKAKHSLDLDQLRSLPTAYVWREMVGPFIFRCPVTGLNVQHIFDDATPGVEDDRAYVGVWCLACTGIHLVSRTTGRLVGDKGDE